LFDERGEEDGPDRVFDLHCHGLRSKTCLPPESANHNVPGRLMKRPRFGQALSIYKFSIQRL
jgi:hypothetical protein